MFQRLFLIFRITKGQLRTYARTQLFIPTKFRHCIFHCISRPGIMISFTFLIVIVHANGTACAIGGIALPSNRENKSYKGSSELMRLIRRWLHDTVVDEK